MPRQDLFRTRSSGGVEHYGARLPVMARPKAACAHSSQSAESPDT